MEQNGQLLEEKIDELLEEKNYPQIKNIFSEMHVQDIAILLEQFSNEKTLLTLFRLISKDDAAEVFSYASSALQEEIVNIITDNELSTILSEMFIDDTVDFTQEMPANLVERVIKNSTAENRKIINKFLSYSDQTAGSIMTNEFIDVKRGMTVKQTIDKIKKYAEDAETINTIYVTDSKRVIEGCASIKDLLLAESEDKIEDIMETNVVYAQTNTDQEKIAELFKKYSITVLPIVDNENRLVGIVTVDDIVDVIEEEATEDIQKMAAITPSDKEYLKTNVFSIWLHRIPWLLILMISAIFTGTIITSNEGLLSGSAAGIILTACIPMLMDTGGNCGSQSSTTIIRGLALNEIKFKDVLKVLWKEIRVAFLIAITLCSVCFLKLLFIDNLISQENGILICFIVSMSMFFTVVIAKIIGSVLPLLAKKLKLDPAVMASPLITTIVDALSLIVFCNIAVAMLP